MVITHYGAGSFRLTVGSVTVALGPVAKDSEWKHTSFGADIVLVPVHHQDTNGITEVTYAGKEPFAITGPGEYEVSDVLVKGYQSTSNLGGEKQFSTSYILRMEKMTLLYLGPVSTPELHPDLKEVLDDVDILFVPVGESEVLSVAEAQKLCVSIEPHVVIPMCYEKKRCSEILNSFEKESGGDVTAVGEKWTVKPKDMEDFAQNVVSFR